MSDLALMPVCPACQTEISPGLLACPGCQRLVHATRLGELAQQAALAEQVGELTAALESWREALDLLPPGTTQATAIHERIEQLRVKLDEPASPQAEHAAKGGLSKGKALAGLGVAGMLLWKFQAVLLFAVTKGKLLLLGLTKASTFLSMFAFFAVYWTAWGWPFALAIVLSIYIHEMGHIDALRRYGFKATAPMFLPGLGAVIRLKQHPTNPAEDARIGLAGPLWGMGAALVCYLVFLATGGPLWAALAHIGAWINIFNLLPIGPLDGSRGFRALSRWQAWLSVAAMGAAWFFTGEGLILLVAIVAIVQTFRKPKDMKPDFGAFVMLLTLIAGLSALVCVRGALPQ